MNEAKIPIPLGAAATVLAVEDELHVRLLIAEYLRDEGYRVIEARDGEEALSILRAVEGVDLVITDIDMPGSLDGIRLAQQVKQHYQLPVILMSGRYSSTVTAEIADAFFAKPFDLEKLAAAAAKLLEGTEP